MPPLLNLRTRLSLLPLSRSLHPRSSGPLDIANTTLFASTLPPTVGATSNIGPWRRAFLQKELTCDWVVYLSIQCCCFFSSVGYVFLVIFRLPEELWGNVKRINMQRKVVVKMHLFPYRFFFFKTTLNVQLKGQSWCCSVFLLLCRKSIKKLKLSQCSPTYLPAVWQP